MIKALGGKYLNASLVEANTTDKKYYCNPLLLEDSHENRNFLLQWFKLILNQDDLVIEGIIDKIYKLEKSRRRLKYAEEFVQAKKILEQLDIWRGVGKYSYLFDNDKDDFGLNFKIMGFSLKMQDGTPLDIEAQKPLVLYYIHKFSNNLDGTASLLIINNIMPFINDGDVLTSENLPEWLEYLTYQNAAVIFASDHNLENKKQIQFDKYFTTIMLLSNAQKIYNFNNFVRLNDQEISDINKMDILKRHFYIKQNGENYTDRLNIDGLDRIISVLSGFPDFEKLMDEAILETDDDPTK